VTFAETKRYWKLRLSRNPFETDAEYKERKRIFLFRVEENVLEVALSKQDAALVARAIVNQYGFHIIPVEIIEMRPL